MEVTKLLIGLLCIVSFSSAHLRDEIPDFEFDDNFEAPHLTQRESSYTLDDFDEFFLDEPELDIATKEKIVHQTLLKALAAKELRFKFSEVLPLLRALSKSQRMVFASIISAQINGGKALTLEEVKEMFGDTNTRPLLLPIVYDLANLVREGFLRSDKYRENEKGDKDQYLRRSFDVAPNPPVKTRTTKEIDFSAPVNSMRDETFLVDVDDEPKVRSIHDDISEARAEPLMMILNNVTRRSDSFRFPQRNLTRDEIEDLALSDLNGTVYESLQDDNGTVISPSPLVGRYRKRIPYRPNPEPCERFTGGICINVKNYPTSEIMGSIRRHRHAMEALLAEFRDKTAENEQIDYLGDPTSDLSDLRRRQDDDGVSSPGSMCTSIIRYARPQKARSATGEWKFIVNTGEHTQTLRLEKCSHPLEPCSYLTENFESSCTQVYNYHRLLSWDTNRGLHVDIFKVPTCCSCHLSGYKEAFPPLASPSNSIANVSLKKKRPLDFTDPHSSSSNRNSQYSTLNDSDDDLEKAENDSSNIAYQFGNGFQRIKPKKSAEVRDPLKNRQSIKRNPSFPDSFLTPPSNGPSSSFSLKRNSNRHRTPTLKRKNSNDQVSPESDIKTPIKNFSPRVNPRTNVPSSTIDTSSVNLRLPNSQNIEQKRVNYNYHPIIDFFEEEEPKKNVNVIDRKTGKFVDDESWRPVVAG